MKITAYDLMMQFDSSTYVTVVDETGVIMKGVAVHICQHINDIKDDIAYELTQKFVKNCSCIDNDHLLIVI